MEMDEDRGEDVMRICDANFFFLQRLQRRRKMDDLQKLQWQKGTFFRDALQFWWNAHETNLARRISKVYPELVDDWLAESWLNSTVQWKGFFWQVYLLSALCKRTNSWNSPQSSPFIIRQIDIYKNFIINYQLTIYRLWTIYDNLKYLWNFIIIYIFKLSLKSGLEWVPGTWHGSVGHSTSMRCLLLTLIKVEAGCDFNVTSEREGGMRLANIQQICGSKVLEPTETTFDRYRLL